MSSTETPTDPLAIPWRPTVDDVAALLRARTKDASGNELGTFTAATRPTDAEVELLITNGCAKVASVVGWEIPADAWAEGMHLAAIWAACEVELSYWPEQVRSDRSPYAQLLAMFTYDMPVFADYVAALLPAGSGSVGARAGTFYSPSATAAWAYTFGYGLVGVDEVIPVKAPETMMEVRGAGKAARDLLELGERGSDIRHVADEVRAIYRKSNARRFASNGAGSWPALAESTVERKQRGGYDARAMRRSGDLEASLTSSGPDQIDRREPTELRFGTTLPYAGYHDTGTGGEKKRELVELTASERDEVSRLVSDYIAKGRG